MIAYSQPYMFIVFDSLPFSSRYLLLRSKRPGVQRCRLFIWKVEARQGVGMMQSNVVFFFFFSFSFLFLFFFFSFSFLFLFFFFSFSLFRLFPLVRLLLSSLR
ncbi:hypothetical protein MAP00_005185 [Monascus purpureus]|nr:hypothetical protein MAP00_005185 [Monascus purpureus]